MRSKRSHAAHSDAAPGPDIPLGFAFAHSREETGLVRIRLKKHETQIAGQIRQSGYY
jgi:hypothetical protein